MKARLITAAIAVLLLAGCSSSPEATSPSASPSATNSASVSATPDTSPSASATPTERCSRVPAVDGRPRFQRVADRPQSLRRSVPWHDVRRGHGKWHGAHRRRSVPVVCNPSSRRRTRLLRQRREAGRRTQAAPSTCSCSSGSRIPQPPRDTTFPATPEGITIGSTRAAVLAAYPSATEVSFNDTSRGPRTQIVVLHGRRHHVQLRHHGRRGERDLVGHRTQRGRP